MRLYSHFRDSLWKQILFNKIEQLKIAEFLNIKIDKFDSIISKKEALIEKLDEAKKSLISEVVTGKVRVVKTDDGYELVERTKEEMKDSGVEWLGDIPIEWDRSNKCSFTVKQEGIYKYQFQLDNTLL